MIRIGDRALIKKIRGFHALQETICWKINSRFSHVEPIISKEGDSVDATVPRLKRSNIKKYFNGQYRVWILRPLPKLTKEQAIKFAITTQLCIDMKYDLFSYLGFVINKPLEHKGQLNCAELVLRADHSIGLLERHGGIFISPQSYVDFAMAGMFDIVYAEDCPEQSDFTYLKGGTK
jgi:hypothetical protein